MQDSFGKCYLQIFFTNTDVSNIIIYTLCTNCNRQFTSWGFCQHVDRGSLMCQYSHAESLTRMEPHPNKDEPPPAGMPFNHAVQWSHLQLYLHNTIKFSTTLLKKNQGGYCFLMACRTQTMIKWKLSFFQTIATTRTALMAKKVTSLCTKQNPLHPVQMIRSLSLVLVLPTLVQNHCPSFKHFWIGTRNILPQGSLSLPFLPSWSAKSNCLSY
jgi:hypothetical protein